MCLIQTPQASHEFGRRRRAMGRALPALPAYDGRGGRRPGGLNTTSRTIIAKRIEMDNGHALTDAEYDVVRPVFNRHLYVSQQAHDWGSRSALNLKLDWAEVQRQCKPNA